MERRLSLPAARPLADAAAREPLIRESNARSYASIGVGTCEDQWRAYDALPPAVRLALREAVFDNCSVTVKRRLSNVLRLMQRAFEEGALPNYASADEAQALAVTLYIDEFRRAEHGEIEIFSNECQAVYGLATPHVAAGASVLRDSARTPRRHLRSGATFVRAQRSRSPAALPRSAL